MSDNIIDTLIAARKQKSLSQTELGEKLGMPQSHISKIERKETDLRLSSVIDMARVLGLELVLVPRDKLNTLQHLISGNDIVETKSLPELLLEEDDDD